MNYYTTIYSGRNNTPQDLIIDTSTSITSSPCNYCKNCGSHRNKYFEAEALTEILNIYSNDCHILEQKEDKSGKNEYCKFNSKFLDSSEYAGIYINQRISFDLVEQFKIPFGCITKESNLLYSQATDGILGLGNSNKNFVNILMRKGVISHNIFSICLGRNGGYLTIGNIIKDFHQSPKINFIKTNSKEGEGNQKYRIYTKKIYIGKSSSDIQFDSIISPEITYSYLPNNAYQLLIETIFKKYKEFPNRKNLTKVKGLGYCSVFDSKKEMIDTINNYWPVIKLETYEGDIIEIKPINYYFDNSSKNTIRGCLGIEKGFNNNVILGSSFLQNFDVIFDNDDNLVSFVESNCSQFNYLNSGDEYNNKLGFKIKEFISYTNSSGFTNFVEGASFRTIISIIWSFIIVLIIIYLFTLNFKCKSEKDRYTSLKQNDTEIDTKNKNKYLNI